MKKFVGIIVATVLAFSLVGCGPVDSAIQNIASSGSNTSSKSGVVTADDDGYAEGRMGDVMRTYFFDYTVNSAYTCNDYEGYTPSEGNKLLVAEITVKNTVSDEQLPEEYDLGVNEEKTGLLVFEVPEDSKDYSISYLEQFSNDTEGDVFFVFFTAKDK